LAANSLESRSLYTYCAKSYSERRYSSVDVALSASKHLAFLISVAHNPVLLPCPLAQVDVRLCCAASSMNDRSTSSMSSCVPRSGVTMLSSSVPQASSATCPQINLELTLKYPQDSQMRIPTDSTSCKRHTIPELFLGRQHFRSLLGFCAHSLVAVPGK
jgi:hypothetical protein